MQEGRRVDKPNCRWSFEDALTLLSPQARQDQRKQKQPLLGQNPRPMSPPSATGRPEVSSESSSDQILSQHDSDVESVNISEEERKNDFIKIQKAREQYHE